MTLQNNFNKKYSLVVVLEIYGGGRRRYGTGRVRQRTLRSEVPGEVGLPAELVPLPTGHQRWTGVHPLCPPRALVLLVRQRVHRVVSISPAT